MNIKNKNIRTWGKTLESPLKIASSIYIFIMKKIYRNILPITKCLIKSAIEGY